MWSIAWHIVYDLTAHLSVRRLVSGGSSAQIQAALFSSAKVLSRQECRGSQLRWLLLIAGSDQELAAYLAASPSRGRFQKF